MYQNEKELTRTIKRTLYARLANLFQWTLPGDIPAEFVEYELLKNGYCGFFGKDGKPFAVRVNPSGEPNAYFIHDVYIYANPILGSGTIKDEKTGVIGYNDPLAKWTNTAKTIIERYAALLAAVEISLDVAIHNSRLSFIATGDTQRTINSYREMIQAVNNGNSGYCVDSETMISDGLKVLPTVTAGVDYLRQLAETREYLQNAFLTEFGIHANTTLKRERQLVGEIEFQFERPLFNIWGMLKEREKLAEKLTAFFGVPCSVKLNPIISQSNDENNDGIPDIVQDNPEQTDEKEREINAEQRQTVID